MAAAVSLCPRGRIPGYQRGAVSLADAAVGAGAGWPGQYLLRGRRRPVDLQLAGRRGCQYPAVRTGFSRRADHPAGAELSVDAAYPCRRRACDPAQQGAAGEDTVDPHRDRGKGRFDCGVGRAGGGPAGGRADRTAAARGRAADRDRDSGAGELPDTRVRGPVHRDRASLSHRWRVPLLRAGRSARCAGLSAAGGAAR